MAFKRQSPQPVQEGGTGVTTMTTAYAPVCAGTTATGAVQVASTGLGTSGYVLTSNGSSALPSFQAASGGGIVTINGDSGFVTGSTIVIFGGSNGPIFTGDGEMGLQLSFDHLELPAPGTGYTGQILLGGTTFLHASGGVFLGVNCGEPGLSVSTNCIGIGSSTLNSLSSGDGIIAIGVGALSDASTAEYTVAIGAYALGSYMSGSGYNVAIGFGTLGDNESGSYNVAIGSRAGESGGEGDSSNIYINSAPVPDTSESNVLRIGNGTGSSAQQLQAAYISGIKGVTVTGAAVLVSTSDQLGVAVSSVRYKENIEDMGSSSSGILKLRPVTFNYTVGSDHSLQTGLIAEEVLDVMPSLVIHDKEGLPQTVKYHELPVLLLNELQKALKRIDALEKKLEKVSKNGK